MSYIQQSYYLEIESSLLKFSVLDFVVDEAIGAPYRLAVRMTADQMAPVFEFVNKTASFIIDRRPSPDNPLGARRAWNGVVREFSRDRISNDEILYHCVIEPRLARLRDFIHCRLFQNKTVPEIIEDMLRHHQLGGADFTFNLSRDYPVREYTTQYNETDFDFIRRLMEEEGLWFRFEQNEGREKIVFGDAVEHYVRDSLVISFRPDSGLEAVGREAVREVEILEDTVLADVLFNDYNYRRAGTPLRAGSDTPGEPRDLTGLHYQWGTHHKDSAYGGLLAEVRHEADLSAMTMVIGQGNHPALAPGRIFSLTPGQPEAPNGWLATNVRHQGGRSEAYNYVFYGVPAETVYRLPFTTPRPKIAGTLPAKVVSPGDYQYAYLDEMGRYRVRLPFDLDSWSPGGDSRPVRLAKPYAGPTYGQHFPLHEDTEVMLAFVDGNPDRPYIAGAMHNSVQPDHVPDTWNTRNVIRTWANNKLRMEDKVGEEHIKLATDYESTQLNLGHLVDGSREERGQGLELRTDGWGVIRAGKGFYVSSHLRSRAENVQLSMEEAVSEMDTAASIFSVHKMKSEQGQMLPPDAEAMDATKEDLDKLQKEGMVLASPSNVAAVTPSHMVLRSDSAVGLAASGQADLTSMKRIDVKAIESLSLFAHSGLLKLLAAEGDVNLEAHSDFLEMAAEQDIKITSTEGRLEIAAEKELKLNCGGGAYIILKDGEIELGCPDDITLKCFNFRQLGPASLHVDLPVLEPSKLCNLRFHFVDDDAVPYAHTKYTAYLADGSTTYGTTDKDGYTGIFYSETPENVTIHLHI